MNPSGYRVRRATLDDIGALRALWEAMRFSAGDLEKRLTEFQVAEDQEGNILGALGFQITGRQARIHSESFGDFSLAEPLRPLLFNRIQGLASNHGIVRLWTQESAPFWTQNGFQRPAASAMERFPAGWDRASAEWLTLQLKDEDAITSLEKEFALFMESEKQRSARALDQARTLKMIVTILAFLMAIAVFAAAAYVFFTRRGVALPPP
jgi:N-acetylglutamate synthase-like GNAT family acetyltransferase